MNFHCFPKTIIFELLNIFKIILIEFNYKQLNFKNSITLCFCCVWGKNKEKMVRSDSETKTIKWWKHNVRKSFEGITFERMNETQMNEWDETEWIEWIGCDDESESLRLTLVNAKFVNCFLLYYIEHTGIWSNMMIKSNFIITPTWLSCQTVQFSQWNFLFCREKDNHWTISLH